MGFFSGGRATGGDPAANVAQTDAVIESNAALSERAAAFRRCPGASRTITSSGRSGPECSCLCSASWQRRAIRLRRAQVMHPVRFSSPAGVLPRFDRVAAGLADPARSMRKVIFTGNPVTLVVVGARKFLACRRKQALPERLKHIDHSLRVYRAAQCLPGCTVSTELPSVYRAAQWRCS